MKTSIYDRIPEIPTDDLKRLVKLWAGMIERRDRSPRHDYHGRCLLRATLELERRGQQPDAGTVERAFSCQTSD